MIQNEHLRTTGTMNHTLSDIMSTNGYITKACRIEWFIQYRACRCSTENNNKQCITILLDNIVLINTSYKPVYCNCFKVD